MGRRIEPPKGQVFGGAKSAKSLVAMSERFEAAGWPTAASAMREVRAVPTIFPGVDAVLGVGGWPTDRFGVIHGPSNEGKSAFSLGLILSFLLRGHPAALIDAERTTPTSWVKRLFTDEVYRSPLFRLQYPKSYEQTVDSVRRWAEAIGQARAHGEVPEDTTGIIILDSLKKLMPNRLLEKLLKEGSEQEKKPGRFGRKKGGGVDGMAGRAAQYKAALNAAWMDELTVLLSQTGTCMVAIGREYSAQQGSAIQFGPQDDFVLAGGQAIFFESSVVARIELEATLFEGEGTDRKMIGERHSVQIRKTKIAGKEVRYPKCYFHTSNGIAYPFGFDRGRDLLEVGIDCGVVEKTGAWFSFAGEKLGQGELMAAKKLANNIPLRDRLEQAVRKTFIGVQNVIPEEERPPDTLRSQRNPKAKEPTQ